jgi:hypothetical protein
MGFQRVAQLNDGPTAIQVHLQPVDNGCRKGDLDIIETDLKLSQTEHDLWLNVEDLVESEVLVATSLTYGALRQGINRKLALPPPLTRDAHYLGVFLGTRARFSLCQQQKVTEINRLDARQRASQYPTEAKPCGMDYRAFFFQFLTVMDGQLQIFDMGRKLDRDFTSMRRRLGQLDQNFPGYQLIRRVRAWVQNLGSLPPKVRPRDITFYLPFQSPSCQFPSTPPR